MRINHYKFKKNLNFRNLFILLFFIFSTSFFSQKNTVSFSVRDADTKNPIAFCYVVVKGKNISSQSNEHGEVNIQAKPLDTLVIYQLGYFVKKTILEKIVNEKNTVLLQSKNITLEEVTITAKQTDTIQKTNNTVYLSFDFYDDHILALVNKGRKYNSLLMLDLQGNVITEKQLSIKSEIIFKDCFENIHLLTQDSIFQIYFDYEKISLLKQYPISSYYNFIEPCECFYGTKYVFKLKRYRALKNTYYLLDEEKKQNKKILADIADSSRIRSFNLDYDLNYFLGQRNKGLGYATSVTEILKHIDEYREELILPPEYEQLMPALNSEVKKTSSHFALFDYTNKWLYSYSFDGELTNKIGLTNFEGIHPKANTDHDTRNLIFSKQNKKGILSLYRYDIIKNSFTHNFELEDFYFVHDFKIKGNYLYFIHKDRTNDLTKIKIIKTYIHWQNISN